MQPFTGVTILTQTDLQRELFTDTGAGTLIRRGNKVHMNSKISDFEDIDAFKEVLLRDREALDARATVERYVEFLNGREFKCYFDDPMEALAIVLPPSGASSMAQLATFTITKSGWLTNVSDNVFTAIQKDFPKIMWTVKSDDENLTWFFDKAEGSLSHDGEVLFWTGIENGEEVKELMSEFTAHGREMFGDINLENKLQKAARSAAELSSHTGGHLQQARAYSTASTAQVRHFPEPSFHVCNPSCSLKIYLWSETVGYHPISNCKACFATRVCGLELWFLIQQPFLSLVPLPSFFVMMLTSNSARHYRPTHVEPRDEH
jgi:N-acetyl-gamma-glutamyl-phosphate reductase/acetylglutamate kinase